jgi:hypothetical protein
MTKTHHVVLSELLPGMQDVFFEVIWRLFPWMRRIWIKESNGHFQLFVEATAAPDKQTSDNVAYHVKEAFTAAEQKYDEWFPDSKHSFQHTIQYGRSAPPNPGYRVLMSDRVFKRVAKEIAPWRLERGR